MFYTLLEPRKGALQYLFPFDPEVWAYLGLEQLYQATWTYLKRVCRPTEQR